MRKYIYFWIKQYQSLDGFDKKQTYLFENFGINLSSEYTISHSYDGKTLDINIEENKDYIQNFYSENISDIKAFVGNNGSGKTSLLRLLSDIISEKYNPNTNKLEYILIYTDKEKNIQTFFYKCNDYKKNTNIKCKIKLLKQTGKYLPLTIYYSSAFNADITSHYNSFNDDLSNIYQDISTDALLAKTDLENNHSAPHATEYYKKSNLISDYANSEQTKIIDFILSAGEDFFKILPIPQSIIMKPSEQIIDHYISNFVVNTSVHYDAEETIKRHLSKYLQSKWTNYFKEHPEEKEKYFINKEFLKDFKQHLVNYYNSLESFSDIIRFASLIAHTEDFYKKSIGKNEYFPNIDLNKIFTHRESLKENRIWKANSHISVLSKKIERIISTFENELDNQYIKERYISFDLKKHKKFLKKILLDYDSIFKVNNFITFKFTRPLSSGEEQFLCFFSRLLAALKEASITRSIDNICLFIDESELYLHPEWQRKWFDTFIKLLAHIETVIHKKSIYKSIANKTNKSKKQDIQHNIKVQLFLATHSPFMLTDLFDNNIIKLKRVNFGPTICDKTPGKTIAGDINGILKSGFFLNGTLGNFMESKLDELINRISRGSITNDDKILINNIGNPLIRAILRQKISEKRS